MRNVQAAAFVAMTTAVCCMTPAALAAGREKAPLSGRTFVRSSVHDPWLFVGGQANRVVNAYDLVAPGYPLVESIATPGEPGGLDVDHSGTLYVTNGNGTVTEYLPGQTAPSLSLSVPSPQSVAVDDRGYVYISTRGSPPGIWVFHPGQTKAARKVTSALLQVPSQIAFGAHGLLYITDNNTGALEMKNTTYDVESLGLSGLYSCPTGVAVDDKEAELFVSGCDGGTNVYGFGMISPSRSLDEGFPADNITIGKVNAQTVVFAPDLFSSTVTFYDEDAAEPFYTLATGSDQALGVAVKPASVP